MSRDRRSETDPNAFDGVQFEAEGGRRRLMINVDLEVWEQFQEWRRSGEDQTSVVARPVRREEAYAVAVTQSRDSGGMNAGPRSTPGVAAGETAHVDRSAEAQPKERISGVSSSPMAPSAAPQDVPGRAQLVSGASGQGTAEDPSSRRTGELGSSAPITRATADPTAHEPRQPGETGTFSQRSDGARVAEYAGALPNGWAAVRQVDDSWRIEGPVCPTRQDARASFFSLGQRRERAPDPLFEPTNVLATLESLREEITKRNTELEALRKVAAAAEAVDKVWRDAYGTSPNQIVFERRLDELDVALCDWRVSAKVSTQEGG